MVDVLGHRILVKQYVLEEVDDTYKRAKALGLDLVSDEKDREQAAMDRGVIIQIGPSAWKDFGTDPWCQVGDHIAFARYSGKGITDPETKEEFLVINDEDVVCRFKGQV